MGCVPHGPKAPDLKVTDVEYFTSKRDIQPEN